MGASVVFDSVTQTYYADSISISENVQIEQRKIMGSNTVGVFAPTPPEGSIDVSFYLTTGMELEHLDNQVGKTGFSSVQVGPLSTSTALLNSYSVEVSSENIVKGAMNYSYYGQLSSGGASSDGDVTIIPAHGAATAVTLTDLGMQGATNLSYSFSQTFEVDYALSSSSPTKVTVTAGTREVQLDAISSDIDFTQSSLTGASGLCRAEDGYAGFALRQGYVDLYNLCNELVKRITFSGYLVDRGFSIEPNSLTDQSLTIREDLVPEDC